MSRARAIATLTRALRTTGGSTLSRASTGVRVGGLVAVQGQLKAAFAGAHHSNPPLLPFSARPFSSSSADSDDDDLFNFIEYPPAEAFVGQDAPTFKADAWVDGEIQPISLKQYTSAGKYVVLVWYPKDFTFVCPTEIIAFSDRAAEFEKRGAQVIVASTDTAETHGAWTRVARSAGGLGHIAIPMLADQTKAIAARYGVLEETLGIALRGTFIIDPSGKLQHAGINNLGIGRSVEETLRLLDAIQFVAEHGEVCPAGWQPGEEGIDTKAADKFFSTVPDEAAGGASATYARTLPSVSTQADLDAAIAKAPAALAFVGATWCGKCRQIAGLVEKLAAGAGGKLSVFKVDASQPGGLAEDALGVAPGSPLPAFRFYKGGRQVGTAAGYKPAVVKAEVEKLMG